MFFLRRKRPLRLAADELRALRLSLNTPVVAAQDLPIGPARAAIVLHAEGPGLMLTVGVRSLASGGVALYGLDGGVSPAFAGEAMDGALSFAEGMGFLFDDDAAGTDPASRQKALARWNEAIGEGEGAPADDATEGDPEPALELFELAGNDLTDPPVSPGLPVTTLEIELALGSPSDAGELEAPLPTFSAVTETPTLPLTKFRPRADGVVAADARGAGQEREMEPASGAPKRRTLGRVRLVRRRPNESAQDARRSWLLRLLTSF